MKREKIRSYGSMLAREVEESKIGDEKVFLLGLPEKQRGEAAQVMGVLRARVVAPDPTGGLLQEFLEKSDNPLAAAKRLYGDPKANGLTPEQQQQLKREALRASPDPYREAMADQTRKLEGKIDALQDEIAELRRRRKKDEKKRGS